MQVPGSLPGLGQSQSQDTAGQAVGRVAGSAASCGAASLAPLQGIQFLIENDLLKNTCEDIAQFLYKGEGLNKTAIGDYLGERYAGPRWLRAPEGALGSHCLRDGALGAYRAAEVGTQGGAFQGPVPARGGSLTGWRWCVQTGPGLGWGLAACSPHKQAEPGAGQGNVGPLGSHRTG